MQRRGWNESLATGDPRVDADHKRLFEMFDALLVAEQRHEDGHAVQMALEELTDYVAVHFEHEQDLMRRSGYSASAIAEHEAEHHRLTERTRDMVLEHRAGKLTLEGMVHFLDAWLADHIENVDMELITHVRAGATV